ncbi:MAG: D-alanyl-D-alanine carboxypeptidase [Treponema sp.]|nr:D-alanyl-D-alanine carboxypeptidase [Treponema sp.]
MTRVIFLTIFIIIAPVSIYAQLFYAPPSLAPYLEKDKPYIVSRAAVLIDANTGTILYSKNPNEDTPPASLAKLMTMHIIMKAINEGRASYDELVPITEESWAQSQPRRSSLMFLEPGQIVTLREILLGLAVSSGNDAAVAAALHFAPSMYEFANMMNAEAFKMGLLVTNFVEASGISRYNRTTAAEFASFCRQYIQMHPHSLAEFHSVQQFSYPMAANVRERHLESFTTITQTNGNSLLRTFIGTDGLKTGFINESGYNIAVTAERFDTRLILVLLGAPARPGGSRIRADDSRLLLVWGFNNFKTVRPKIGKIENVRLWNGRRNRVELVLSEPAEFTAHTSRADNLFYEVVIPDHLTAPVPAGLPAGYLGISDEMGELIRIPLVTARAYERGNFLKRLWHSILMFFMY